MPNIPLGSQVTFSIKAGGSAIPDTFQVYAIHIDQTINSIATATISLFDGDPASESFAISSSAVFVPGQAIEIAVGYDGNNSLLFSGIVTKQSLRVANAKGPMLEVECKDKAVKMTVGRKSAAFSGVTDSDVITTLINNYTGLTAAVAATANPLPELVQYYVTDWDFMLARADVNGMLVSTINNTVAVFNPTTDTTPVLSLTYGASIFDFNADLNAITQLAQVTASGWDYANQTIITAQALNDLPGPGNLSSKTLAGVVGLANYELQTTAAAGTDELLNWAKAQMLKSELSKITGDVRFQGTAVVAPGKYVTLAGLGARFDGDHFVSSVRHDISGGNWVTEVNIGLSPEWYLQSQPVEAHSAAGLLPGMAGLFNATVKQIDADPDSES